jgi:hypothetical protein
MLLEFVSAVTYTFILSHEERTTMTRYIISGLAVLLTAHTSADTNAPAVNPAGSDATSTNTAAAPKTISIQEMLVIGHSSMKLHSLAMITQGKVKDGVDERFLPGFKACSEDDAIPVRSVAARLLGQHFISGKAAPDPEAVALLIKLAQDESPHVRYNAVYYGLTRISDKSPEIIELLVEEAEGNREQRLFDRIAESLAEHREETVRILDRKLNGDAPIACFEIYEDLAGRAPAETDRFLDLPSSLPKLFIFRGAEEDAEAYKAELESRLTSIGLRNPDVSVSGAGTNYALLLKTYLTRDRIAVEEAFADDTKFTVTQEMWLTPELEAQIEAMPAAIRQN